MSYHPSKDFSDLYLSLLEQYRNLAFGRAVQFFFLLSLYLLQSTLFFAGFTSFMGFIGTMQHLSWFTFVMRFLHIMKNPISIFFMYIKSDWQSLTCFQHWKKMNISFRILDIHKRTFLTARFSGIISFRFIQ